MLEPLTVAVMGLELALIIQSKPVRIASDNFGSNSASAFQADAYQQKPHLLLVGRAKPIQSPPLRFIETPLLGALCLQWFTSNGVSSLTPLPYFCPSSEFCDRR
jgi:hypothetical protein